MFSTKCIGACRVFGGKTPVLICIAMLVYVLEAHGQESQVGAPLLNNTTSSERINTVNNTSSNISSILAHSSREGVSNLIFTEGGNLPLDSNKSISLHPVVEVVEVAKSSVHARKGAIPPSTNLTSELDIKTVDVTNINNTQVTYKVIESIADQMSSTPSSSTRKPPQKPTLTISLEEAQPDSPLLQEIRNSTKSGAKHLSVSKNTNSDGPSSGFSNLDNSRSQPGFIIPLVITMFAVPMLAFVGYQAVKRGKEAWKNRHYRRMDFLIDGMYND